MIENLEGRQPVWTSAEAQTRLGKHRLDAAVRTGRLTRPWPGVVIRTIDRNDPATMAAAALLAAGPDAALSGPTAARMFGCTAIDSPKTHVTVPYSRWVRSRGGLVVHHDRFPRDDVVELDGLRVMTLDYVVTELLCTERKSTALACVDQALATLPAALHEEMRDRIIDRLRRRDDRRGTISAGFLIEVADGKAESPAESWARLLVIEAGFPMPVLQHEIVDGTGRVVHRLDLAWPELRVALEYDGAEAHDGRQAADAERDARLSARGWLTVRATAEDLARPTRLVTRLQDAFHSRGAAA